MFFGTDNPYCDITLPPSTVELEEQLKSMHVQDEDIVMKIECTLLEMF